MYVCVKAIKESKRTVVIKFKSHTLSRFNSHVGQAKYFCMVLPNHPVYISQNLSHWPVICWSVCLHCYSSCVVFFFFIFEKLCRSPFFYYILSIQHNMYSTWQTHTQKCCTELPRRILSGRQGEMGIPGRVREDGFLPAVKKQSEMASAHLTLRSCLT